MKERNRQFTRTRWGWAPLTNLSGRATVTYRRGNGWPKAQETGVIAFWCGVPSARNPYSGSLGRKLWNRGWQRARMASQRGMPWGSTV